MTASASQTALWPRALYDLTMAVARAHEPHEIYEAALNALDESLGIPRSSLLLFDEAGVMRFRAWRNLSDEYRAAVDGHSPWDPDTTDAVAVLVPDVRQEESLAELLDVFEREGIAALGFIPLRLGHRLLGKFMLYFEEPHSFGEEEVQVAEAIAAHVAFAIDQAARRNVELRYASLAETAPALVAITSAEGEVIDVDSAYQQYTGLTAAQARDWENHQVIHPDDLDDAMEAWTNALRTGTPLQNEMRLRRHDGAYRWYLMTAKPIHNASGRVDRWVTVSVDIEDRKLREARDRYLAQTTAELLSPIDSTDALRAIATLAVPELADICSIGLFDGTSRTARIETALANHANQEAVAHVHLREWRRSADEQETIGALIAEGRTVFIENTSAEWVAACAPTPDQMAAGMAIGPRSIVCVPLISRGSAFGMATFAMIGDRRPYSRDDVALLEEVAARLSIALENRQLYINLRDTADSLSRANASKDEFLALVSHELKTPLTTIRGNASLLATKGDSLQPREREAALGDIVFDSERLNRIIENLLLLARAEQGQAIDAEPLLLIRVAQRVVERHRRAAPSRRFEIRETSAPRLVVFSEASLELILENLLSNAEKYSPADTPIVVDISRDESSVVLRVLDEGSGIDDADADTIFDPFFRSQSTQRLAQGLGIGLTVCRRLVEASGGQMWGINRHPRGAEFGFRIPVPATEEP